METYPHSYNIKLKYEQLLTPFGKKVYKNLVKQVTTDVKGSKGCSQVSQQQNAIPSNYRKRRVLSVKKSLCNDSESTNNVNKMNLSIIHEEGEIKIHSDTDIEISDKVDNAFEDVTKNINTDAGTKEVDQQNDIKWDDMIEPELLEPSFLEILDTPMDIDSHRLNDHTSFGGKSDHTKYYNEVNMDIDSNFDTYKTTSHLIGKDKENIEGITLNNKVILNTDANSEINDAFVSKTDVKFSAVAGKMPQNPFTREMSIDCLENSIVNMEDMNNWRQNIVNGSFTKPQPQQKRRLKQIKITDLLAKNKINIDKNHFRKVKYTKTIKNWLNNVNNNNFMETGVKENVIDTIVKNNIKNGANAEKKCAKKKGPLQTQLANKDGVMKFK